MMVKINCPKVFIAFYRCDSCDKCHSYLHKDGCLVSGQLTPLFFYFTHVLKSFSFSQKLKLVRVNSVR